MCVCVEEMDKRTDACKHVTSSSSVPVDAGLAVADNKGAVGLAADVLQRLLARAADLVPRPRHPAERRR